MAVILAISTVPAQAGVEREPSGGYACGDLCTSWFGALPVEPDVRSRPPGARRRRPGRAAAENRHGFDQQAEVPHRVQRHRQTLVASRPMVPPPGDIVPAAKIAAPTTVASLAPVNIRGGYPSAIPPDPDGHPLPAASPADVPHEDGPAWAQAALRVFEGLNDVPASGHTDDKVTGRRRRSRD